VAQLKETGTCDTCEDGGDAWAGEPRGKKLLQARKRGIRCRIGTFLVALSRYAADLSI